MHIADTKIVAKIPKAKPQNLKAMGIDRIPVPKDAFSRCVNVPQSLKQYKTNYKKIVLIKSYIQFQKKS